MGAPSESQVEAAARFADQLRRWREYRGLSKRALAQQMAYDRTYLSHIEGRTQFPTEDFTRRAEKALDAGGALWQEWLAFTSTRSRHRRAASPPEQRDLRTAAFIPWIAQRSGLDFQQAYASVVAAATELETTPASVRHARDHALTLVTRQALADTLAGYYRQRGKPAGADDVGFYRAGLDGAPDLITTTLLTRPGWLDVAVGLGSPSEESFEFVPRPSLVPSLLPDDAVAAAVRRLAEVETTDTVVVDNPLYRLLEVDLATGKLAATVTLGDFLTYALTSDLLEGELVTALADTLNGGGGELGELSLRRRYLPSMDAALAFGDRICIGGTDALLAVARPADAHQPADYVMLAQERSARVLNTTGKLATIPKAFHQPTVDSAREVPLSMTLEREFEEELLGREDLEYISTTSQRQADPRHLSRSAEPMQWLLDRRGTDAYRIECVGFGINMVSGNYMFPALIVIDDEDWWLRYGHEVEANWETARMQRFSSLDTAGLRALALDPRWTNEGLFTYLEGLRRLAAVGDPKRLALPGITAEV